MACKNKRRVDGICRRIRHGKPHQRTRYDNAIGRAFRKNSPWEALRVINKICKVMHQVGPKLMKKYNIKCKDDYCCLHEHIERYRNNKIYNLTSRKKI